MSENPYSPPKSSLSADNKPLLPRGIVVVFNLLGIAALVAALMEMQSNGRSDPTFVWLSLTPVVLVLSFTKFRLSKLVWATSLVLNVISSILYAVALGAVMYYDALMWPGYVFLVLMLVVFSANTIYCKEQKPNYAIKGTSV